MKHTITILALLLMCTSLSAQTGGSNRNDADGSEPGGSTRSNQGDGNGPSFRNGGSADVFNSHNKTYSGKIYTEVTTVPVFVGGTPALLDYLDENTSYPEEGENEGTIYVQFVVETDGVITNATIVSGGLDKYCNAEALRVIMAMPKWTPGKVNGKAVRCYQKIGVRLYQ